MVLRVFTSLCKLIRAIIGIKTLPDLEDAASSYFKASSMVNYTDRKSLSRMLCSNVLPPLLAVVQRSCRADVFNLAAVTAATGCMAELTVNGWLADQWLEPATDCLAG